MSTTPLHSDEQEEEESYFVSMTDIMVGLLFIFIILLMYLVLQLRDAPKVETVPLAKYLNVENARSALAIENQSLRAKIAKLEDQLKKLKRDRLEDYLRAADASRSSILREIQKSLAANNIPVEVVEEQGILRLKADLLFESGRSIIIPGTPADHAVSLLAGALRQSLPCFTVGKFSDPVRNADCNPSAAFVDAVFIEGHTDSDHITGEIEPGIDDNLRLSSRRATNTLKRMLLAQPDLSQFFSVTPTAIDQAIGSGKSAILNASAYGDSRPIAPNDTQDGKRRNRRIDIRLLMYTPRSETIEAIENLVVGLHHD